MRPLALLLLAIALLAAGCASSGPAGSGLLGWWAARGERAEARARDRHDEARERQLEAARIEAEKTAQAAAVLPPSPEATLTQRFAGNTSDLLAQAVPGVTAEQLAAVRQLVADLRSGDEARVAAAERRQADVERGNAALSRELGALSAKVDAAEKRAAEIAADNARLAGERLALLWASGLSTAAAIAGFIAVRAYRANAFGLADGVARGIAELRRTNATAAEAATAALDYGLNRSEQTAIARRVAALV